MHTFKVRMLKFYGLVDENKTWGGTILDNVTWSDR